MRRLAVALGACLMAPSATLHALGMGDIDVHSGLNQPLKATIKLISVDEGELNGLDVALAPKTAFERMGLDRLPVLSKLSFNVVRDKGAPYIEVTSQVPVREPFLDFILSVNWANGQMLREYTLLLDPPVFDKSEKASPIEAAATSPATIERDAMDEFEQTSKREVTFNAGPGSYGPTKTTDTLWAVAKSMRPDASVSVPQMMLALLKENPEAFLDNNINQLKAGYILRAPQMETITELSKAQAAAEANRQYQAWLQRRGASGGVGGGGQRQVASGVEGSATGLGNADGGQGPASKARLQLVSPENAEFVAEAGGSVEGKVAALQQQLLVAQEAAQVSQQESAALRARLKDLEQQLANMKKLISLQDDTMSALQGGLAEQQAESIAPEVTQDAKSSSESEQVVAGNEVVEVEQGSQEATPLATVEEEGVAAAGKSEEKKPAPAVRTPPPETSFFDDLLANPNTLATVGGVSVLLLLLVGLMVRRRRQSGEDELADIELPLAGAGAGAATAAAASTAAVADAAPSSENESASAPGLFETKDNSGLGETVGDIDEYGGFGSDDLGTIHAEESEIDPIAEADVYLAYRRYEQAESLLKEAIQNDESRHELKLKLMEIYFTTKDQEAFEAQAEALYAALGGAENGLWDQAVEMGRELCPDHPLFSESGGILPGDSDISDDSVLDLGDEFVAEGGQDLDFESLSGPEPTPVSETDSDFDLEGLSSDSVEFDLDLGESLEGESGDEGAPLDTVAGAEAAEQDAGSEFDLGLDESFSEVNSGSGDLDLDLGSELDSAADLEESSPGLDDLALGDEELGETSSDDLLSESPGEVGDLELDLPELGEEAAERDDVQLNAEDDQASEAALPEDFSDLDLGLGVDDEFAAIDVSGEEGGSASEEENVLVLDDEAVAGSDDAFDLDTLDDLGGLDNVVSFETPDTPLSDIGLSEDDQLKLEDGVEDLANALGEEAESMTDFSATEEFSQSTAEEPETESSSPEWEVEPAISNFGDMDEEYSLFESTDDVVGTKLDLAKAYIDMGDQDGARSILDEVVKEGSDTQREEAQQLMQQMG